MAKQTINLGTSANDGTGDGIRTGGDKINDNFTELYDDVALLQATQITAESITRTQLAETCDGTIGQTFTFSSQFVSVYAIQIIDYNGIGIEVTAQDQDGFTITSLSSGTFGYIALVEI